VAKQQSKLLNTFEEKRAAAVSRLKQTFSGQKTTQKNVVQHTNDSLHLTHDTSQDILAEIASLAVELTMRIGESYLVEPFLSEEDTGSVNTGGLSKHAHQALYARYILQLVALVRDQENLYSGSLQT
jgi:hypothetical protein